MVRIRIRIWIRNQNRKFPKSAEPDPELMVLDPQHCFKSDPELMANVASNNVAYWFRWWCAS